VHWSLSANKITNLNRKKGWCYYVLLQAQLRWLFFSAQSLGDSRFSNSLKCMHERNLMTAQPEEPTATLITTKRAV
jgi:hypothetical protein